MTNRLLLAVCLVAPALGAQDVPATFSASARVDSIAVHGDTTYVTQTVINAAGSPASIGGVALEAPAPVVFQSRPSARHWLLVQRKVAGRPAVVWNTPGSGVIRPGSASPALTVGALGIPDVVYFWAVAYLPVQHAEDPDHAPRLDPIASRSIRGLTVGVVPVPSASTAKSLTVRLRSLLTRSCGELGWITNAGVCHSLDAKLQHAIASLASGDARGARGQLAAFSRELDAQHGIQPGKHVGEAGYSLLHANAQYLLARL